MRTEFQQSLPGDGVLVQQREIDRAAADALDHVQHARQRDLDIRQSHQYPQQPRQQGLQAPPAGFVEVPVIGTLAQLVQLLQDSFTMGRHLQRIQQLAASGIVDFGGKQMLERLVGALFGRVLRGGEHRAPEMRADARAVQVQLEPQRRPVRHPHGQREARARVIGCRQLVRLLVIPFLQAVFDTTQESVRLQQLRDGFGTE